jgi:hypothetical protein
MLLRLLFRNLSLFPLFPFFVLLFVPIQYFPSIFFDPFHQSLPLCIFHITFGFSFPILPLLFLISCSSFSYSPVGAPSHEHTFFSVFFYWIFHTSSCCLYLFAVSCHYFPPFFFPYILLLLPFLVAFL